MEPHDLRKKVLLRLVSSPGVLIPPVVGMTVMLGGWAMGMDPVLAAFLGCTGLVVGAGSFVSRFLTRIGDLTHRILEEDRAEEAGLSRTRLDELAARLRRDRDERTDEVFARLREVHARFTAAVSDDERFGQAQFSELRAHADELYRHCVESLRKSAALWETASMLTTPEIREGVLERRETLIGEIVLAVDQLLRILDSILALDVSGGEAAGLARIRAELDDSLNVARRVDERMRTMQAELDDDVRGLRRAE